MFAMRTLEDKESLTGLIVKIIRTHGISEEKNFQIQLVLCMCKKSEKKIKLFLWFL